MDPRTGQIKPQAELTDEERKTWIPIPPAQEQAVRSMNRAERRAWAARQRKLQRKLKRGRGP